MRLSVVFGTRGTQQALPHLERIFHDLSKQTFQDFQVIVVVDRKFKDEEDYREFLDSSLRFTSFHFTQNDSTHSERIHFFTNLNSEFFPQSKGGASAVRNFGLQQIDTELVQLFDDDNGFDPEYLEKAVQKYDEMRKKT
ncbi:MAG: glycosyltransferase family 2 protein [Candidatus Peribacteria bacterium]|jgi:glycosyltransferase involved in cell wall biosynthesis|nr:glycosyltransferase family 2 protein [Candidatus Peribacteria bacterium]